MSMSQGYLNNSIKEKERENRLRRIKEVKDLDKKMVEESRRGKQRKRNSEKAKRGIYWRNREMQKHNSNDGRIKAQ